MQNDVPLPARDSCHTNGLTPWTCGKVPPPTPPATAQTVAARHIRPLASFRHEDWHPGPLFWEPGAETSDNGLEPERILLNLTFPMAIAASVFISILFILT